jgi:NAD(P)-dependent dehydrogenase (short-subunit alcohol dehydrogenase family)
MKLNGKTAIVTAAGRGIGRAIALCLAEEGADVVVNSYREETTARVVGEVKEWGRNSLGVAGDITDPGMIERIVKETIAVFGKIDILVNNVGGGSKSPPKVEGFLGDIQAEWDAMYRQNLRSTVLMCSAVASYFIQQKSGKIVNISSGAGRHTSPTASASYGSMKAAVIIFSQYLADKLGPYNINVNCICPGLVYTDIWEEKAKGYVESMPEYAGVDPRKWFVDLLAGKYPEMGLNTPLRREQTADDMGRAVVFLVSEDAKNISGQALNIDGGRVKN